MQLKETRRCFFIGYVPGSVAVGIFPVFAFALNWRNREKDMAIQWPEPFLVRWHRSSPKDIWAEYTFS